MMPNKTTYVALLTCGHTAYYDPRPIVGDKVYCRHCRDYSEVEVASLEWSVRCADCRLSRVYGTDKDGALRVARKHLTLHGTHTVRLLEGHEVRETFSNDDPPLPAYIEWTQANPDHQRSLRALSNRDQI